MISLVYYFCGLATGFVLGYTISDLVRDIRARRLQKEIEKQQVVNKALHDLGDGLVRSLEVDNE